MTSIQIWLSETEAANTQRELERAVWEQLTWEPCLDPQGILLDVTDYVATLRGTVRSYPERLAFERAARRVPGIQAVVNETTVVLPPADERTDAQLGRAVAHALAWDVFVPRDRVAARVANGGVTLEGAVERPAERTAAEEVIQRVRGVRAVSNRITVEAGAAPPDESVRGRVEAALRHEAQTHGRHIRVEVRRETVVLRGHVRSLAERLEVERAAEAIPGVSRIQDELTVQR